MVLRRLIETTRQIGQLTASKHLKETELGFSCLIRLWANDLLHCVGRERRGCLLKFQPEIAENRVDGLQVCEVHVTCTIWGRRGQPHRPPTFSAVKTPSSEVLFTTGRSVQLST
jgi:hypothetical protein